MATWLCIKILASRQIFKNENMFVVYTINSVHKDEVTLIDKNVKCIDWLPDREFLESLRDFKNSLSDSQSVHSTFCHTNVISF